MDILLVGGMGLFRVVQSVTNKKVSFYTENIYQKLYFGVLFESAAAIFSFVYLFIWGFNGLNAPTLLFSFLTGVGFLAELLTSLCSLNRAPLGLCTICSLGGGIVLPAVLGIFLFNEPLSLLQWIGIVLFLLAALLSAPPKSKETVFSLGSALPFLIANFLINGALSIIGKYYAVCVEVANPALFSCCSYAIAAVFFGALLLILPKKTKTLPKVHFSKKIYLFSSVLGIVCATIVFLSIFLAKSVPIVILNTVPNAICIVGSSFIGYLHFKEKLTKRNMCGVLLGIISIVAVLFTPSLTGGI